MKKLLTALAILASAFAIANAGNDVTSKHRVRLITKILEDGRIHYYPIFKKHKNQAHQDLVENIFDVPDANLADGNLNKRLLRKQGAVHVIKVAISSRDGKPVKAEIKKIIHKSVGSPNNPMIEAVLKAAFGKIVPAEVDAEDEAERAPSSLALDIASDFGTIPQKLFTPASQVASPAIPTNVTLPQLQGPAIPFATPVLPGVTPLWQLSGFAAAN